MEGLVLNHVEIPAEKQDMGIFLDMENFHDLIAQHHTQDVIKTLVYENKYIDTYINCTLTYFSNRC